MSSETKGHTLNQEIGVIKSYVRPAGTDRMFYVVEMPLNAEGQGPEMDPTKVTEVRWQVWDEDFLFIADYDSKEEAEYYACSHRL